MRVHHVIAAFALMLAACGQQPSASAADLDAAVSDAERAAVLAAAGAAGNPAQIENECGELVAPQLLPANLGDGVGRAVALVMTGGPNSATCYGDGPLVTIYQARDGAWREIYAHRGGPVIVLPAEHNGANDLADGGPGFSFPVWEWNGNDYVSANRSVADSALGDARFIPN